MALERQFRGAHGQVPGYSCPRLGQMEPWKKRAQYREAVEHGAGLEVCTSVEPNAAAEDEGEGRKNKRSQQA